MESVANLNGGVNLPIALSTLLLELYIQYFSDKVLSYPTFNEKMLQQAIRIAVLAVSESGSNAVLEKLKLSNSNGYKGIGMIHWLLCPYQPLPFTLTTEDAKLLRVMLCLRQNKLHSNFSIGLEQTRTYQFFGPSTKELSGCI